MLLALAAPTESSAPSSQSERSMADGEAVFGVGTPVKWIVSQPPWACCATPATISRCPQPLPVSLLFRLGQQYWDILPGCP